MRKPTLMMHIYYYIIVRFFLLLFVFAALVLVVIYMITSPAGSGIFPDQGSNPNFLHCKAGRFFTTELSGKSYNIIFKDIFYEFLKDTS